MTSHLFLASLVAGAIDLGGLAGGEPSRPDDPGAGLAERCRKILDRQVAIHDSTRELHKAIQDTTDKKPRDEDRQKALKLAAGEVDIIREAARVIDRLEAEKVQLSTLEVLREVRKDMERVERSLKAGDVGAETQALEREIVVALKDTIAALKPR